MCMDGVGRVDCTYLWSCYWKGCVGVIFAFAFAWTWARAFMERYGRNGLAIAVDC